MASYPTVTIDLWTEDAVVLHDWLSNADLRAVLPNEHDAVLQALTDLLSRLEEAVPYEHLTPERIASAQHEVSKHMGW
jgi:hypothetical protein